MLVENTDPVVESTASTPSGFLVDVAPAQPRPAVTETPLPAAPPAPDARFTEQDIQRAREQEKSKVYSRLETLQDQVARLAAEADARAAADAEATRLAGEAEKARIEAETDVRDLLKQKEQEWTDRFAALEQEREMERALREKETAFHEFQNHKQQAVAAATDDILPELLDFVSGETPEEIALSIAGLRERSAQIMNNTTEAIAATRRDQRGVQPTGLPLSGPLDNETAQQQFTKAQIDAMPMSEFKKYRSQLGVTRSTSGRGLFS